MIGAVIGDLATWTWEHDRECFYERLVSPEARLSGYGLLPIIMWPMINEGGTILKHRLYMVCGKAPAHCHAARVDIPEDWHRWGLEDYEKGIPFGLKVALIMSTVIDSGYLSERRLNELNWISFFHGGKQEYYAARIMDILRRLNEGATKDEAIKDIPEPVINYYPSGSVHTWRNLLEYTTFAWRCFYYSFDFTSALHNAAKCTAHRHLAMMLTGALAEAMYGCTDSMTKQKFGGNYEYIEFPPTLPDNLTNQLREIRIVEFNSRQIFKKNDALTTVEIHTWTNVDNPYPDRVIDQAFKEMMMKAYGTSWDNRYGVYLDNGWLYVYRSHHLLLRYKLSSQSDSTYRITNLQISNDEHARVEDLVEVLYSLNIEIET